MSLFARFATFWRWLSGASPSAPAPSRRPRLSDLQIHFKEITFTPKTPANSTIGEKQLHVVRHNGELYWALFRCPSGCGEVINLSLRPPQVPKWRLSQTDDGLPSLYPSVWRNKGCMSHFWVEEGRIVWCRDSGLVPSEARPDLYLSR